jgi:hypothetical protein
LFEQAVLEPFSDFVKEYASAMRQRRLPSASAEEGALDYLRRLYDFCVGNRDVALAILMAASHEDVAFELQRAVSELNTLLQVLETVVRDESKRLGRAVPQPALAVRLTLGMTMAVTVLDDWFFGANVKRPAREEMVAALADFVLFGVNGRPAVGDGTASSLTPASRLYSL